MSQFNQSKKLCRWGDNCRYRKQGKCYFYHPPQNNQYNKFQNRQNETNNNYGSKSDYDAFKNYPSKPKIIANPRRERTFDPSLVTQGIKFISYRYSFGIIGYKFDEITNKYVYLCIQHYYNKEWGFPKGHFDQNKESNSGYDTAKREFIEETGIKFNTTNIISVDWNNPFILNYEFIRHDQLCKKWTVLFVAKLSNTATPKIIRPNEIGDIKFLNIKQVHQTVRHTESKNAIQQFHSTLINLKQQQNMESKQDCDIESKHEMEKVLIILRGFPGAGKSSLSKSIIKYYKSLNISGCNDNDVISCSFDKYHWSGEEGNGIFKFDFNIHRATKKWCKDEVFESMKKQMRVIIVDNGNFEIWEYLDYIKWAKQYKYKILIIEINSENKNIKRIEHIQHIRNNMFVDECYLCVMQQTRCKMDIPNNAMITFIKKWECDKNAIVVEPKFNKNDEWSNDELVVLLNKMQSAQCFEYPEDSWNDN